MKWAAVAAIGVPAFLLASGCMHPAERVVCGPYDGKPDHVRQRVIGGVALPAGSEVLRCEGHEVGSFDVGDVEQCAIRLPAGGFEILFPGHRYQHQTWQDHSLRPYLAANLARSLSATIAGTVVGTDAQVSFDAARELVIVQRVLEGRCGRLSEVI